MKRLKGIVVPIVTPFDESDEVSTEALRELCDYLIDQGIHGLYPCGTTGEAVLLTDEERKIVAATVVSHVQGRVPVFVQIGAASTQAAVALAKHAVEIGADGIAAVTPYYFKYDQKTLTRYYEAIIAAVPDDYPIYLYNIPMFTGNDLLPSTVGYLAKHYSNVVGIKNTMPDIIRAQEYLPCGQDFSVMLGNDLLLTTGVFIGCDGVVSANAQVAAKLFVRIYDAAVAGDWELARTLQEQANAVTKLLQNGGNISLLKYAIAHRGVPVGDVRAPLTKIDRQEAAEIMAKVDELGGY